MLFQFLNSFMRSMMVFINAATIAFVIKNKNIAQQYFIVEIVPTLGYLQQVWKPAFFSLINFSLLFIINLN
jgi:hypothetical protein